MKSIYYSLHIAGITLLCLLTETDVWGSQFSGTPDYVSEQTFPQQNKYTIRGKVYDEKNIPLPGVSVKVEGTLIGCATDIDGNFSISYHQPTGILIVSFVGYKTLQVPFKENTPLKIKMQAQSNELDEVTVVAYGKQNTREVTGSISSITNEQLKGTTPNFLQMIQGIAAGVDIKRISNSPGGGGDDIEIRGRSTLSVERDARNSGPLYVVDGVPIYSNVSEVTGQSSIVDINPEDILRIDILKDASSTSIYGSRAANGVILITTKKGRFNEKAKISASVSYSYEFNPPLPGQVGGNKERQIRLQALRNYQEAYFDPELNRYVYADSYEDAYKYKTHYDYFWNKGNIATVQALQDSLNPYYNHSTNFTKYLFQNGKTLNGNLQISGGAPNIAYFVGLNYYDQTGILKNTGFQRLKLTSNLQIKPKENFQIDLSNDLSRSTRKRSTIMGNRYPLGSFIEKIPSLDYSSLLPGPGDPVFERRMELLNQTKEKLESYRLRTSLTAAYTFLPGFELKTMFSIDYNQANANTFYPSNVDEYGESNSIGQVSRSLTWINENLLNYNWSNDRHAVNVLLGASFQAEINNLIKGWGKNAPSDLIQYVSWYLQGYDPDSKRYLKDFYTDYSKSTLAGFFGRVNYNFMQKYLASFTIRRDASSRFGEDVRWATFPSFSVGYAFTKEPFMQWSQPYLSYGKLRLSFGKSGRQFSQPYVSFGVLQPGNSFLGKPSIVPYWQEGLENRDLTWEECNQFDVGLDLEFFNHKVNVTLDYYYKYTDKILYNITLPGDFHGYIKQWQNAYAISNQGIELQVKWNILQNEKMFWNLTFNAATNKNRLEKSVRNRDFQITTSDISENFYNNINVVGRPINGIYAFPSSGIYQSDDEVPYIYQNGRKIYLYGSNLKQFYRAGDRIFYDTDGSGNIITSRPTLEDRIYVGSPIPKVTGGINSSLRWKNFDFNITTFFSLGGHILNLRKGASLGTSINNPVAPIFARPDELNYWEKLGDKTNLPANRAEGTLNNFATNIAANVEKVNFLKVRSLTVGYTFPKFWGLSSHLAFTAENLLTWTNYSGPDPETVDPVTGIDDLQNYPIGKVFKVKFDINF